MPQPTTRKKATSNGRVPAYQNKFAFRHNPKSKKTATILASPIEYCCQRCYDKIVWRKQYRKYKPLTQPTSCNLCNKRNITAAYHTVCNTCSISHPKAIALLQEWNGTNDATTTTAFKEVEAHTISSSAETDDTLQITTSLDRLKTESINSVTEGKIDKNESSDYGNDDNKTNTSTSQSGQRKQQHQQIHKRVCTVCFKQPALPDGENDDTDNIDDAVGNGSRPLKLRQLKSIQRQKEKQQQLSSCKQKKKNVLDDNETNIDNVQQQMDEEDDEDNNDSDDYEDNSDVDDDQDNEDEDDNNDNDEKVGNAVSHLDRIDDVHHLDNDNEGYHHTTSTPYKAKSITTTATTTFDNDDDLNDPFLQAIGGAKNLLVGEAYQKMLLEKKMQN